MRAKRVNQLLIHHREQVLMDGSGHHANGEVGVRPELGASACKPSTRYARIPPGPLLKKGEKLRLPPF
jgi:hypothetical protein